MIRLLITEGLEHKWAATSFKNNEKTKNNNNEKTNQQNGAGFPYVLQS